MPTVVITGAGSGLGRELARAWAAGGWSIIATDRNLPGAQETVSMLGEASNHRAFELDVTLDDSFAALLDKLDGIEVDVVVNNAGIASAGRLISTPMAHWNRVLDVNLLGVVRGCRAFIPTLRARGGHLVNIASFAGLANAPAMSTYNVTKAGVIALSETLRTELSGDGIDVTVVCPSFFQTPLLDDAEAFGVDIRKVGGKLMDQSPLSAEDVARRVVADVAAGRFMCIPHRDARWLHRLKRLSPETFARLMVNKARGLLRTAH